MAQTLHADCDIPAEEQVDLNTGHLRFDIDLLASQPRRGRCTGGCFGTPIADPWGRAGAARILLVLPGTRTGPVQAPTLLIVASDDHQVTTLNRRALGELRCEKDLSIVPGASHLFEEPGTLEQAAKSARNWFEGHLKTETGA